MTISNHQRPGLTGRRLRTGVALKAVVLAVVALAVAWWQPWRHGDPLADGYSVELLLPMTPVKDQGDSDVCWAYAMLATIETEHLLRGDSVNLSGVYVRRRINRRSMCQTLLNRMAQWGMVGYDVLPDDATDDLPTPQWVFLLGARYTPQEFAHSVCAPDEYVGLTSQPDSPYYQKTVVSTPDNWERNRLLNLPAAELRRRADRALRRRHPVCWESAAHAMAIVGLARDAAGRHCYILKNSWGTSQPHGGLVYMEASALWRDAVAVYMTRDAYDGR